MAATHQPQATLPATLPPSEVAKRLAEGAARNLIDVRTPAEFSAVHAASAKLVPLDTLDPRSMSETRAAKDQPIYLLCKSGGRATKARDRFLAAGVQDVIVVEGGTEGWERAGCPVERSNRKTISLERQVRIAAGTLVLIGVALGFGVHPALFGLSAFVGAGLVFAGITDWCGMGMLLARMPWNR
jgi:rhodanese-related sulfurtransferase